MTDSPTGWDISPDQGPTWTDGQKGDDGHEHAFNTHGQCIHCPHKAAPHALAAADRAMAMFKARGVIGDAKKQYFVVIVAEEDRERAHHALMAVLARNNSSLEAPMMGISPVEPDIPEEYR